MTKLLNKERLQAVQDYIQEQARLRCIPTTVTVSEDVTGKGKSKISVTSTPFNTVPVLHSEITLTDFGSEIWYETDNKTVEISVGVSFSYEGNGTKAFHVRGRFFNSKDGYESPTFHAI